MWHRTIKFAVVVTLLGGGIYAIPVAAQELQNWHWAPPIGLTENDTLRLQFVAVKTRVRVPETSARYLRLTSGLANMRMANWRSSMSGGFARCGR